MVLTIENFHKCKELKQGDSVEFFPGDTYLVMSHHLMHIDGENVEIFKHMELMDRRSRTDFCARLFGYTPDEGYSVPLCRKDDYPALYRLICGIFTKLIELGKIKDPNFGDSVPEYYPVFEVKPTEMSVIKDPEKVTITVKSNFLKPNIVL